MKKKKVEIAMGIEAYKPTYIVESVYDIQVQDVLNLGIQAILVDLDNTLIAWNKPDATPRLEAWLAEMSHAGISVVVVSNNNARRVARAVASLELAYVSRAMKPFKYGIHLAIKRHGFDLNRVIMVGDQLMTDIRAANRVGIRSVLVKPLVETDSWGTKVNRFREQKIKSLLEQRYGPLVYRNRLG